MTRGRDPRRDGRGGPPLSAGPAGPSALRTWPRIAAALVVAVVGCTAAWAVDGAAARAVDRQEQLVATQTADLVAATIGQVVAAVGGVPGLADQRGVVDEAAFAAFATGVSESSPIQVLAFVPVVPADERAGFEEAIGRPITVRPGGAAADDRDTYLPVRWIEPSGTEADVLVGVDVGADPARNATTAAAHERGGTVIGPTVSARPTGEPAVFVAHPVYRQGTPADASAAERRPALVGFVTTALTGQRLLDVVAVQVDDPLGIRIEDVPAGPDAPAGILAETSRPPGDGVVIERTIGGRGWRVTVDDRQRAAAAPSRWILAGTAALTLTLLVLARRAARHQRDVDRHVALVEGVAGLGRSLAAAGSVDELARAVEAEVPGVLGVATARLRPVPERADPPTDLRAGPGPGPPGPGVRRWISDESGTVVAVLELVLPPGRALDDLTLAGLSTVAEMCGQSMVRARLADDARRDAVSSRLLAGLAEAAATAGTVEQVARTLVSRAADVSGAAATRIGVINDDGRALVVHHANIEGARVVALDAPRPLATAARTGEPVLLPDLDMMARDYPTTVAETREAGLVAVACTPLVHDGRTVGALGLGWPAPRSFGTDLLAVMRTTADICAASLTRARATDLAQARSSALAGLAAHLSASSSFDDVGTAIVEHAPGALGADFALVGVVEQQQLRLLAPAGPHLDVLAPYLDTAIDVGSDFPALVALQRREVVTFASLDKVSDPAVAADLARMGLHAGACAPLLDGDGEPTGVFVVLWRAAPTFDEALRTRVATVADLCAQSVERSRLFDAEHRVRRDIQRSVLARPPAVGGLDVATRYRPAALAVGMGGDWYDAITLEGDRLCLVVGDVTGHGVGAIAKMTQVRTVIHTLVAGGMALPDILVRTSAVMQRDDLGYATVLIAVLDPREGAVTYVTAGHPPPMLRRPGGTVDTLTGGRHSVLGIGLTPKPEGYVSYPVGSVLVGYTDGLIERPGTSIDVSILGLADELRASRPLPAGELADRLLANEARGPARDDTALVVARRTA